MRSIVFVGMDVHKATIAVAVAEGGRDGDVRQLGVFPNRAEVIARLVRRLADKGRSSGSVMRPARVAMACSDKFSSSAIPARWWRRR